MVALSGGSVSGTAQKNFFSLPALADRAIGCRPDFVFHVAPHAEDCVHLDPLVGVCWGTGGSESG